MANQTCYDWVVNAVEIAADEYAGALVLNKSRFSSLKPVCEMIDDLIDEFSCDSYNVEIDYETTNLLISFTCMDIVLERGRTHKFFHLIQNVNSFRLSNEKSADNDEGYICVEFCISDLWVPEEVDE